MVGSSRQIAFRSFAGGVPEFFGALFNGGVQIGGINNFGQVAAGITDQNGNSSGLLYGVGKKGRILVADACFTDLNDDGQAVGYRFSKANPQALNYAKGKVTPIGGLGGHASLAVAVNNNGQIAGNATNAKGQVHAFLYQSKKMQDVGDLGGGISIVMDLSDSGMIVGYSKTAQGAWHPFAFDGQVNVLLDLKTLSGFANGIANGVNNDGIVVGTAYAGKNGKLTNTGFRYTPTTGLQDLNQLVDSKSGVVITQAFSINNMGEILAYGTLKDQSGYLLLKPGS